MAEHVPGYQRRDWEVVDYQLFQLNGTGLSFRGPKPSQLETGDYFACIGAAQTLGCLCERPFPTLLQNTIGLPALNLGYGGAGPYFFLKHRALLDHINNARFVIVQVMAGRSESNRLFDSGGLEYLTRRADGRKMSSDEAYAELLRASGSTLFGSEKLNTLARMFSGPADVRQLVEETRANWIASYQKLLQAITPPTVLFWFSKRRPWYWQRYNRVHKLMGEFPQLVTPPMLRAIRPYADAYVECVSKRGIPQFLISRFTGERVVIDLSKDREDFTGTWTTNRYYPTPEMHEDAARALVEPCRRMIDQHGSSD